MCEAFDKAEARGRKIGEAEGEARGRKIGVAEGEARGKEIGKETMLLQNARSLMKTMQWTAEQTLEKLMISENDRGKYVAILEAE